MKPTTLHNLLCSNELIKDITIWRVILNYFKIGFYETADERSGTTAIHIEVGENNVVGYGGYCACIRFTPDGSFIEIGIWE